MEKKSFTLEDIQEFLLEQGYPAWNGEIYDTSAPNWKRPATLHDFDDDDMMTELAIYKPETDFTSYLAVGITNFEFVTYDKDHTEAWQTFMLKRHKKEYAKAYVSYLEHKQRVEIKHTNEEIEDLKRQINEITEEHTSLIQKLILKQLEAKKYLTDQEYEEIVGEPNATYMDKVEKGSRVLIEENLDLVKGIIED